MFLGKGVLKICSKFTGEHPCQSAISIKLRCKHIKVTHLYFTADAVAVINEDNLEDDFNNASM